MRVGSLRTVDSVDRERRCLRVAGFTLIELLVVMAIVATLLGIVLPRYMQRLDMAKEVVLKENLMAMRTALDQHLGDRGIYPEKLKDLVDLRYLREVPMDPITERRDSWVVREHVQEGARRVVHDVRSGAPGKALDGSAFGSW